LGRGLGGSVLKDALHGEEVVLGAIGAVDLTEGGREGGRDGGREGGVGEITMCISLYSVGR